MSTYPVGRPEYKITAAKDHGNYLELGDASHSSVGMWSITFVPDASFAGSLGLLMRGAAAPAAVGYVPTPYRSPFLNGVVPAQPYAWTQDPITGYSIALVPASGLVVAILVSCTAGFGWLYSSPLAGSPAV